MGFQSPWDRFDLADPHTLTWASVAEAPAAGTYPYRVRVTQVDQERAWSSPVYVTRRPGGGP